MKRMKGGDGGGGEAISARAAEAGTAEEIYECEYNCGSVGSYEAVADHEKICPKKTRGSILKSNQRWTPQGMPTKGCECPPTYPTCSKSGRDIGWCYNEKLGNRWYSYVPWWSHETCGSKIGDNCAYNNGEIYQLAQEQLMSSDDDEIVDEGAGKKKRMLTFDRANVKKVPMLNKNKTYYGIDNRYGKPATTGSSGWWGPKTGKPLRTASVP